MKSTRCGLCSHRHTGAEPRSELGSPIHKAQSAPEDLVKLSITNADLFLPLWDDASNAYWQAAQMCQEIDAMYKDGTATVRYRLRPLRDRAYLTRCRAIRAMWHLPHPTQIRQQRVGCLAV